MCMLLSVVTGNKQTSTFYYCNFHQTFQECSKNNTQHWNGKKLRKKLSSVEIRRHTVMCQLGKTTKQTINDGIRKTPYYFEITMVVTQAIFLWSMWFYPLVKRRMRDDSQLNQELRRYKSVVITQRQTGPLVL